MSAPSSRRGEVAVVTIVAGRHRHLANQQRGLALGTRPPDHYVVVAMDDPEALRQTARGPLAGSGGVVHPLLVTADEGLPLAAARNAGASAALAAGADTLLFLDVDCIPSATLVARYASSVQQTAAPTVHCGVVRYLGADIDASRLQPWELTGPPHPARPAPAAGSVEVNRDWPLFWSLSFALSAGDWHTLGGFDEAYRGYGAEDTDLGYRAQLAGFDFRWLGGADAFHQYHPTHNPPVQHLDDIVRNATVFHDRWGFWPMEGWLRAFREQGLVDYVAEDDRWQLAGPVQATARPRSEESL